MDDIERKIKEYGFSEDLSNKVRHSISVLRKSEEFALRFYNKGFYLAFSGGKDSQALYYVAKLAGVKFEAHMNMTTVDPAPVVSFVKREYPDVVRHIPKMNFFDLILKKKKLPSRTHRFCCDVLKEGGGGGTVTLVGIRAEESVRRAKRSEIGTSKKKYNLSFDQWDEHKEQMVFCVGGKDKIIVSPILSWTEDNVWEFLNKMGIKHCELYDKGEKRIGCILCPMSNVREMLTYPFKYPHQTNRLLEVIETLHKDGSFFNDYKEFTPKLILAMYLSKRLTNDFLGLVSRIQNGTFKPDKENKELWDRFIDYFDLRNIKL